MQQWHQDQVTGEIGVISNDLRLESGCCSDPNSTDATHSAAQLNFGCTSEPVP